MKPAKEQIEVNLEELTALVERARQGPLSKEDCQRLAEAIQALSVLIERIGEKNTTISPLRALLSKPSTEKTSKVLEQAGIKVPPQNPPPPQAKDPPKPGHGRNGAQAYRGAKRIKIAHGSLKPGDHCPGCLKGKVYLQKEPGLRIRVMGQAPIAAPVYELERLRCNLCGEVYEAEAPQAVGEKKYKAKSFITMTAAGRSWRWRGRVLSARRRKPRRAPGNGRDCSPPASWRRRGRGSGSRCSSPGGILPGRTSPGCSSSGPRDSRRPFKCRMPCPATCRSSRRSWKFSGETATRTPGAASSR